MPQRTRRTCFLSRCIPLCGAPISDASCLWHSCTRHGPLSERSLGLLPCQRLTRLTSRTTCCGFRHAPFQPMQCAVQGSFQNAQRAIFHCLGDNVDVWKGPSGGTTSAPGTSQDFPLKHSPAPLPLPPARQAFQSPPLGSPAGCHSR